MADCKITTEDRTEIDGFSDEEARNVDSDPLRKINLTKAVFVGGERDGEAINLTKELVCMTTIGNYTGVNFQVFQGEVRHVLTLFIWEDSSKATIKEKKE